MKHIKILGVDIAKDVFQLCGIDRNGKIIYKKRVKRGELVATITQLKAKVVAMEACGGTKANKNARIMWALLTRQDTYRVLA